MSAASRAHLRAVRMVQWTSPAAAGPSTRPFARSALSATLGTPSPRSTSAAASCSYSTTARYGQASTPYGALRRPRLDLAAHPSGLPPQTQAALLGVGVGATRSLTVWPFSKSQAQQTDSAQEAASDALQRAEQTTQSVAAQAQDQLQNVGQAVSDASTQAQEAVSETVTSAGQSLDAASGSTAEALSMLSNYANEFEAAGLPTGIPPVSTTQYLLEWLSQSVGLPWWVTIIGVTCALRLALVRFVIRGQVNNIRMANIQPQMQPLMKDLQIAKESGDMLEMQQTAAKVQRLMRENDASPIRSIIPIVCNIPVFLNMFFAIRGMANGGLLSMKTGGILWFTDLTLPDQYVALPIISSMATLLVIETGAESGAAAATNTQQQKIMKNVIRALLIATPYFTMNFPAAVHLVWTTNSLFSMGLFGMMRTQWAKRTFGVPERVKPPPTSKSSKSSGGFLEGFRQGMSYTEATPYANYGSRPRPRPASVAASARSFEPPTSGRDAALQKLMGPPASSGADSTGSSSGAQQAFQESLQAQKEAAKQKRVQASRDRRAQRRRI